MGLFTQLLSLNRLPRCLLTICKKSQQHASNSDIVGKERCIKEQMFFELLYVSCIYFTNQVLQNCFCGVKFRAKFEVLLQKQFLSVVAFKITCNGTFLP